MKDRFQTVLVDNDRARAAVLGGSLQAMNADVVVTIRATSTGLVGEIPTLAPDVVLLAMTLPCCDVIADIDAVMQMFPCTVVAYAGDRDPASIARAIDAGISAYVTDDILERDLQTLLDLAAARFQNSQSMRNQLQSAHRKLDERKNIDRAKALLAQHQGLDESSAHQTLQQLAMNQRISLGDAAKNLVAMLDVLPARKK